MALRLPLALQGWLPQLLLPLLLLLLNSPLTTAQDVGQWYYQAQEGATPRIRFDGSFVRVGDYFYLLGGYGSLDIDRYDPRNQTWSKTGNKLPNLHHFQARAYGGKVYIMGALTAHYPNDYPSRDVYVYDPGENSVSKVASFERGRERGAAALVVYGDALYVVGGHREGHSVGDETGTPGSVAWMDKFEPKTGKWTKLPDAPRVRDHATAEVVGGRLYLVGGGRAKAGSSDGLYGDLEASIDVYDFSSNKWLSGQSLPDDLPVPATGMATAVLGDEIVVMGGKTASSLAARADTYILDVASGDWRRGQDMIRGRHATHAATQGNRVYIAAGAKEGRDGRVMPEDPFVEFFSLAPQDVEPYAGWAILGQGQYVRAEGQVVAYEDEYYFFNGFDVDVKLQNNNEKYNPRTKQWTKIASIPNDENGWPQAATHTGIAIVGDVVWIVGGRLGNHPGRVVSDVWLYDISEDSWRRGPSLPVRRGAGGLAKVGSRLHYIGGFDENAECDVAEHWVYDLDLPEAGWQDYSTIAPMPLARNHFGTVVMDGMIYTVGGQHGHDGCEKGHNQRYVHRYDPIENTWKRLADLPDAQSHTEPSTFSYNKKIYSLGGQGGRSDEVWEYDPRKDTWTVLTAMEMPLRLIAAGARVYDEDLYVMGGGEVAVNHPRKDVRAKHFAENTARELSFYPRLVEANPNKITTSRFILSNLSHVDEVKYTLNDDDLPDWLSLSANTDRARQSTVEVKASVNPSGLSDGEYSYTLRAQASGYTTAEAVIRFRVTGKGNGEGEEETPEPDPTAGFTASLEAECAEVGTNWVTVADQAASEGSYVTIRPGLNAMAEAPDNAKADLVRFRTVLPSAGTYRLFARLSAPSSADDSFWVRINGGAWQRWWKGIQTGNRFDWRLLLGEEVSLPRGELVVDFSYREDGTLLDKLVLTNTAEVPGDFGPQASNCGNDGPGEPELCNGENCSNSFWAEIECGERGGGWRAFDDQQTSSGKYVEYIGSSRHTSASTNTREHVVFETGQLVAGTYGIALRLRAPNNSANSIWMRVDGGEWMKFWRETDGSNLLTKGFEWRTVYDDRSLVSLDLEAGSHVITIANREAGTQLDKLFLGPIGILPDGLGEEAGNCTGNSFAPDRRSLFTYAEEAPASLKLYPNPVQSSLTVDLTDLPAGEVRLAIIDPHGRVLLRRQYDRATQLTDRIPVDQLLPGTYRISVVAGSERLQQLFIKGK